jgi:hypothetical protein
MQARWLARLALGLVVVYLLAAAALGVRNTALRLRALQRTAGLSPAATRALVFGRRYTAAVEEIRSTIAIDEPYLLREMNEPGAMLWVRFDLLPRRAIVEKTSTGQEVQVPVCLAAQIRWLVVAAGVGRPPLLYQLPAQVPPGCPTAPWMRPAL